MQEMKNCAVLIWSNENENLLYENQCGDGHGFDQVTPCRGSQDFLLMNFFFFFYWYQGSNSQPRACKAGAYTAELNPQPPLLMNFNKLHSFGSHDHINVTDNCILFAIIKGENMVIICSFCGPQRLPIPTSSG